MKQLAISDKLHDVIKREAKRRGMKIWAYTERCLVRGMKAEKFFEDEYDSVDGLPIKKEDSKDA